MFKDTHQAIEQVYVRKLKEKTDVERALMGFSMFETSRCLVKAGIKKDNAKSQNIKIAVFNKFYSADFDPKARNNIIRHLKMVSVPSYSK